MLKRLLLAILCCMMLCCTALAAEPVINSLKTDCVVSEDGTASFIQTLTVTFATPCDDVAFPIGTDVLKCSLSGLRASRFEQDGVTYLKLKNGVSGSRTFTLNYTLKGLVSTEDDRQLLTLPLWNAQWPWSVESYAFTVTLPTEYPASPSFFGGYDGELVEDFLQGEMLGPVYMASLTKPMRDHASMTMTLSVQDGYFSGSHKTWTAGTFSTVLVSFLTVLALAFWFLKLRSARLSSETRTLPPDSAQPCDLPYLLCGRQPSFHLLVMTWANLGYLSVSVDKNRHILLHRRVEMGSERRSYEPKAFARLFGGGDVCDCGSTRYRNTARSAQNAVVHYWERRLYSRDSGSPMLMKLLAALSGAIALLAAMSVLLPEGGVRWLLLVLSVPAGFALHFLMQDLPASITIGDRTGIAVSGGSLLVLLLFCGESALVMLMSILLSLFTGWQTMHGGKRGQLGTMLVSQALGYRRYLAKISDHRVKLIVESDPQYFYRALPDAVALGLGDGFAEKFEHIEMEPCGWYQPQDRPIRNAADFYSRVKEDLALLKMYMK